MHHHSATDVDPMVHVAAPCGRKMGAGGEAPLAQPCDLAGSRGCAGSAPGPDESD